MRIGDALDQTATAGLRRVAAAHNLPHDDAATRAELIDAIQTRLLDRSFVHDLLARLDENERQALLTVRAAGGEIRGFLLDRDTPGAADALAELGVLYRTFTTAGPRRGEVFSVPDELLELLPEPPEDEAPPRPGRPPPPGERRASEPAFSVFALASTLGRPGADLESEVRGWSAEPGGWPWRARWDFLRHLCQAAGLFVSTADGALAASNGLLSLLSDPPALAERLFRAYLNDRAWSDLAHAGLEHGEQFVEASQLRASVLDLLQVLAPGGWLTFEVFSAWVRRTRPDFLREQLDARALVLLEARPWSELESPLLRYVVFGPLYWLGRVTVSADGVSFAPRASAAGLLSAGAEAAAASTKTIDSGTPQQSPEMSPGADAPSTAGDDAERGTSSTSVRDTQGGAWLPGLEIAQPPPTAAHRAGQPSGPEMKEAATSASRSAAQPSPEATQPPLTEAMTTAQPSSPETEQPAPTEARRTGQLSGPEATQAAPTVARRAARAEPCTWEAPAVLLAPPRADLGRLLRAERYLVLQERGRPSRYHLVQQHVAAALAAGGSLDECRRLLTVLTQAELPAPVVERLDSWRERFGALFLRPTVILEARSADELEAALTEPTARRLVRGRLGPTAVEVAAADALQLAAALRESGHLPRVDAALRLASEPRRTYAGLVDEQVLEFLLVSLLAFDKARPERLAQLEGAPSLLERLQRQFAPSRLAELRQAAEALAGDLRTPSSAGGKRSPRRQKTAGAAASGRAPARSRRPRPTEPPGSP